jgi:alpha-1,3-fucosyltransferase 10
MTAMRQRPADAPRRFEARPPRILIYQDIWGSPPVRDADDGAYEIWRDRARWEEADAVVFHLPELRVSRFPPRKRPGQVWVAWCMESEAHYPMFARRAQLGAVFDLWMTYRRDSDVWCPYLERDMPTALRAPLLEKTEASPAVAFISSPYDLSGRIALLDGLLREMPVDSYGKLRRNRLLHDDSAPGAKLRTIARYKFTLAFENAIGVDYVTEKFFDPLRVGSVPVYLGAPNVEAFAPGDNCFIDATRFESPRALARHVMELAADESRYAAYLRWKSQPLRPSFLRMAEAIRPPFALLADRIRRLRADAAAPEPL